MDLSPPVQSEAPQSQFKIKIKSKYHIITCSADGCCTCVFYLTGWKAVATWHWMTGNDEELCGICRNPFDGCCPDCRQPGDDCPLIHGECSHCFHMHCLLKWIQSPQSRQQCPMDRRPWVTASS